MPTYEVSFEVVIEETIRVEANSPKDAEDMARSNGWRQMSEDNWEIVNQSITVEDQATADYHRRFRKV